MKKNNNNTSSLGVIAIVAALALLGIVVVTVAFTIRYNKKQKPEGAQSVHPGLMLHRDDASADSRRE